MFLVCSRQSRRMSCDVVAPSQQTASDLIVAAAADPRVSSTLACQQSVVVSAEYCHQLLSVLSSQCRYLVVCVIHFVRAASNAAEGGLVFCQCFFFYFLTVFDT